MIVLDEELHLGLEEAISRWYRGSVLSKHYDLGLSSRMKRFRGCSAKSGNQPSLRSITLISGGGSQLRRHSAYYV